MTTIILTTLGILLAAAAALTIVFYGGDLYKDGDLGARANTVMNAGANVVAAVDRFRTEERSDPASVQSLVDAGYLSASGAPAGLALATGSPGRVTISGVPADVCTRINVIVNRGAPDDASGSPVTSAGASVMQGCTVAGSSGTYFALV